MSDYLNKIKTLCDMLGSAGCRVMEVDHILHILSGLGAEYNPVMVVITSKGETWSVQDVAALLLNFESRLEATKSSIINMDGSQPSAHLSHAPAEKQEIHPNRNGSNYNRGEGNRGGGHFRGRGGRGGYKGRGNRVTCQLCQKPGHMTDKCWYRYQQNFLPAISQPRQPNFNDHYGNSSAPPSANMAQSRGNQNIYSQSNYGGDAMSSSSWYPDSGATNHVTNDFANLTTASKYNGGNNLLLGDGHGVPISHVGQFVAKASPSSTRALHLNNLLSVAHFTKDNNVFFEFHPFHCFVKDQA